MTNTVRIPNMYNAINFLDDTEEAIDLDAHKGPTIEDIEKMMLEHGGHKLHEEL